MKSIDRDYVTETVKTVLARDYCCGTNAFDRNENTVGLARETPGRRKFPFKPDAVSIATMGKAIVAVAGDRHLSWLRKHIRTLTRDEIFSPKFVSTIEARMAGESQHVYGPNISLVYEPQSLKIRIYPKGLNIELLRDVEIHRLYDNPGYRNALRYNPDGDRPDVLAAAVWDGKDLIAVAAASQDCREMYQIGVDVIPEYRAKGIGTAAVSHLTREIFEKGIIPYYSTRASNIASLNTAIGIGYYPLWTELYSK